MKRVLVHISVLALFLTLPIFGANTMAGKWKASSGYTVNIPDNSGSFILIFEDIKGEKITHPAQWTNFGKEFTWTDKQGAGHTATLDPGNPDRICDINSSCPESPAYWYRIKN